MTDDAQTAEITPAENAPATITDFAWPDDWRERMAGGDDKVLGFLKRTDSPVTAARRGYDLGVRVNQGTVGRLPDNPTSTDLAEYRAANGIPDTPSGYFETLPEGVVIGEADKPLVSAFAEKLHAIHAKPDVFNAAVLAFHEVQTQAAADRQARAKEFEDVSRELLKEDLGPDYQRDINLYTSHYQTLDEATQEVFRTAMMADGTYLLHQPELVKYFARMAFAQNPQATTVPSGLGPSQPSLDEEMSTIEALMKSDRARYEREGFDARYQELLALKERRRA